MKKKTKSGLIQNILRPVLILCLVVALIYLMDIGCIIRTVTGIPCPGCGLTRACIAFLQGRFVDAFYWHPLFWLTVILLMILVLRGGKLFGRGKAGKWIVVTLILMYLAVYIVRMVLLFPHTPPMDLNKQSIGYQLYLQFFAK